MHDADWVNGLPRAKLSQKYEFQAVHILAPLRNAQGIAPVVLETPGEYLRAPAHVEACFELCLRHLNRLQVPWPAQESLTAMNLLANRASEALRLPNRFVPMPDGTVEDLSESNAQAPPPSPVCAKEDMCEDTPSPSCAMQHVDLTARPGWFETTSNAASPLSQTLPLVSAEWPQDLQALLENAALPTVSADLPHDNAAMCADFLSDHAEMREDNAALREDSFSDNAAMREDCPCDNAALREDFPSDNAAMREDSPVHENAACADSPMLHENAACADSPMLQQNTTLHEHGPVLHDNAADATAPGRSLSKRARRRAVLRARKQQQQR